MIIGIFEGFQADFDPFTGQLVVDVYLEDKRYKVIREHRFEIGGTQFAFCDRHLTNGQSYFARFFTVSGGDRSTKTDFIKFVPVGLSLKQQNGREILQQNGEPIII